MKAIVSLLWVCAAGVPALACADGAMDGNFGEGGIARAGITDGDGAPSGCKPVVQGDGKIVICGTRLANGATGSDFLVVRFNADGTLDESFGTGGRVTIDFDAGAGADQASGIVLQDDGKIIVGGTTRGADMQTSTFAVARLEADGTPDPTFGPGAGKTTIDFDLGGSVDGERMNAITIAPDGAILLAGSADTADGTRAAVARLRSTGALDATFNSSGVVTFAFDTGGTTNESDEASGVAVDATGRVVVVGTYSTNIPQDISKFGAARLLADGTLDTSFAGAGHTVIGFDPGTGISDASAYGVIVQADGRIMIPGYANTSPYAIHNMDMAAVRLLDDGSPDATFGVGGQVTVPFDLDEDGLDAAVAAVAEQDGRVLLVGTSVGQNTTQYAAAARLMPDGTLDASFGTNGQRTYNLALTAPATEAFTGVTYQGTSIVIAGVAYVPPLGTPQPLDNFVVRLSGDSIFAGSFD